MLVSGRLDIQLSCGLGFQEAACKSCRLFGIGLRRESVVAANFVDCRYYLGGRTGFEEGVDCESYRACGWGLWWEVAVKGAEVKFECCLSFSSFEISYFGTTSEKSSLWFIKKYNPGYV